MFRSRYEITYLFITISLWLLMPLWPFRWPFYLQRFRLLVGNGVFSLSEIRMIFW